MRFVPGRGGSFETLEVSFEYLDARASFYIAGNQFDWPVLVASERIRHLPDHRVGYLNFCCPPPESGRTQVAYAGPPGQILEPKLSTGGPLYFGRETPHNRKTSRFHLINDHFQKFFAYGGLFLVFPHQRSFKQSQMWTLLTKQCCVCTYEQGQSALGMCLNP